MKMKYFNFVKLLIVLLFVISFCNSKSITKLIEDSLNYKKDMDTYSKIPDQYI
eukprot:jgi/Orpsp1_1/1182990/evm.model.c7180000083395.1